MFDRIFRKKRLLSSTLESKIRSIGGSKDLTPEEFASMLVVFNLMCFNRDSLSTSMKEAKVAGDGNSDQEWIIFGAWVFRSTVEENCPDSKLVSAILDSFFDQLYFELVHSETVTSLDALPAFTHTLYARFVEYDSVWPPRPGGKSQTWPLLSMIVKKILSKTDFGGELEECVRFGHKVMSQMIAAAQQIQSLMREDYTIKAP